MNDKDLERIEKKIDLLFKILLDLNVDEIGYPYDFRYLGRYGEEIRLLYNLDIEKERHKVKFPNKEEIKDIRTKLEKLQKRYEEGDYLAKEKQKVEDQIAQLQKELQKLENFVKNRKKIEEALNRVNYEVCEVKTYIELRKKVGLSEFPEMEYALKSRLQKVAEILDKAEKGLDPTDNLSELKFF